MSDADELPSYPLINGLVGYSMHMMMLPGRQFQIYNLFSRNPTLNINIKGLFNMIVCCLRDWEREKFAFHPIINKGIEYITQTDFTTLTPGKFDIIPDKMFCLLQEMNTVPAHEMRAESHFRFADIQFLLQGEETIGVARGAAEHEVAEDRAQKHDIVFYQETNNESLIRLEPGMFAVFFPQDLHRPCCNTRSQSFIRKAVIKIHLSLFNDDLFMNNQ